MFKQLTRKNVLLATGVLVLLTGVVSAAHSRNSSSPASYTAPETKTQDTTPMANVSTPAPEPVSPSIGQPKPATSTPAPTPQPKSEPTPPANPYESGSSGWYVWDKRTSVSKKVGNNWFNFTAWAYYAQNSGYIVNLSPEQYAIITGSNGLLGFVDSLNADGTITISCMNCYAGYARVGTKQISAQEQPAYKYIH